MDLSNLATKDTANNGKWFQVELYDTLQDFDLLIYGGDSDVVVNFNREQFKKFDLAGAVTGNKKKSKNELDDLINSDEGVIIRVGGIRCHSNPKDDVILCGKTLGNDKESVAYLLEKIPAIKTFINEKSNERTDFLPEQKKN